MNLYIQTFKKRLVLVLMLLVAHSAFTLAGTKLYIEDFSIAGGETKKVAVCLDTDVPDIFWVEMNLSLPEGLEFVADAKNNQKMKMEYAADRAPGLDAESSVKDGKIIFCSFTGTHIAAGNGPIFYFYVKEKGLATEGIITMSDVKLYKDGNSEVSVDVQGATVSNNSGVVTGKPVVSFSVADMVIYPGKTAEVEVMMENKDIEVQGFQADLVLPEGWTAVVTNKRGSYMYRNGRILNSNGVTGEEGAMFTLALTAPVNFEGEATIKLTGIKATVNWQAVKQNDVSFTVKAKNEVTEQALADLKEEITTATTLLGEADKTVEPGKTLNDAITAAQAVVTAAEADMMIAKAEDLTKATETLKAAEEAYTQAVEDAAKKAEDAALAAANDKLAGQQAAVEALKVSAEAKAYDNEGVQAAVKTAEDAIAAAVAAVKAVETKIAEGKLSTDNKDALAAAVAAADKAIEDAKAAIAAAEKAYADQKAADDAAAAAAAANKAAYKALTKEIEALQDYFDTQKNTLATNMPSLDLDEELVAIQAKIDALQAQLDQDYAEGKLNEDSTVDTKSIKSEINALMQSAATAQKALDAAREALVAAVEEAKAMDTKIYTEASVKTLVDAIAAAEEALAAPKTNAAKLNAAKEVLDAAVKGLEELPTYKVNEVVNGTVVRTTEGYAPYGQVSVPYRRYNVVDGALYQMKPTGGNKKLEYNHYFDFSAENTESNVSDYAAVDVENVVYLSEGEDIEGMTLINSGNTTIRSSNSAAGYAAEDVDFVTLPAGTYKLTAGLYDSSKNPASTWTIKSGETVLTELNCTVVNLQEVASDEFTLDEETTLTIAQGGKNTIGIDYIYIVKIIDTGISNIRVVEGAETYFDLTGKCIAAPKKGQLVIVKMTDGRIKKMQMK